MPATDSGEQIQHRLLETLDSKNGKHLDPTSPAPVRMMAARGMAPLPPRDMVVVLCGLSLDADASLAQAAQQALQKLPEQIVGGAIDGGLPAEALDILVDYLDGRDPLIEKLLVDRNTPDGVIAKLAPGLSEALAEIVLADQQRALRSQDIVRGIAQNPNALKSSLDRMFDFLVRSGVFHEGMPQFAEAFARLSPSEQREAADQVSLPQEASALLDESRDANVDHKAMEAALDAQQSQDGGPADSEAPQDENQQRVPMLKLVASLNVSQKIALAMKGNKEARAILLRDSNKLVAAIRNPGITEQEVVAAAGNRSISEEVLRIIAQSKDMVRPYSVKVALVHNPKTPLQVAMKFLSLLRGHDLRDVAKSRNISSAVANQAKRMLNKKR